MIGIVLLVTEQDVQIHACYDEFHEKETKGSN